MRKIRLKMSLSMEYGGDMNGLENRWKMLITIVSSYYRPIGKPILYHFLGLERFEFSVDPIFLIYFDSNMITVDIELSKAIHDQAKDDGLAKMMENQDFRIDYGTITSCHMIRPEWDKPIVSISGNR